jgi:hypothetical protein
MSKRPVWLIPVLFCAGGLLMAHHPMLKDGLGWTQFDLGDTRFCNYLLEHGYRWLLQKPNHTELWSPPFFFPTQGHLAWAENMLGALPFYVIWRALGFPLDTAFQLWIFTLGALNFLAMYLLLRRAVKVEVFAASVGAVLFAFAGMRINQSMHYQLFPQFFSVWAVHACWRLAADARVLSASQRVRWLAVLLLCVAFQIAVGIYLGWFLVFGLGMAFGLALLFKDGRERIGFVLKSHPFAIALLSAGCVALLLPIARHYLGTAEQFGGRPFQEVLTMVPPVQAWFHFGNWSWFYGWTNDWEMFRSIPMQHEQRIGYGLLTTALCVAGLWAVRRDRGLRFLGLLLVLLILCTTLWGKYPDGFTLWKAIWSYFPGAKAIRGVARIALLYLIGVSVLVAVALDRLRARGTKVALLAIPLGLGAMLEQAETTPAFSNAQARADVKEIVDAVGPECEAFFFSPLDGYSPTWKYQLDAMMAELERGVPTVNGYSGQLPAGWEILGEPGIRSPYDEERNATAVQTWLNQRQVKQKVCWAKVGLQEGPLQAQFISQKVPAVMLAGQRVPVTVRLRNIGTVAWDPAQGFLLGSQAPRDGQTWGTNRVRLPGVVKAGDEVDLTFDVAVPTEPGKYPFQWRMVLERVKWFGNLTPLAEVDVQRGQ